MKLRVGYQLDYEFPQPTPMILVLNVHHSRVSDLSAPDHVIVSPSVPISGYRDGFEIGATGSSRRAVPCASPRARK